MRSWRRQRTDPARRAFAKNLGCVVGNRECQGPVDPHHEPPKSSGGWHDWKTVGLCRLHHDARHGAVCGSREAFEARYNVDLEGEIDTINEAFRIEGPLF